MPRRVAFLVCANGLGHARRSFAVAEDLAQAEDVVIDCYCAPWQVERLARWSVVRALSRRSGVRFVPWQPAPVWRSTPLRLDDDIQHWYRGEACVPVDAYDLVVSDNLVEPVTPGAPVLLMGSFLWHDVFLQAFPDAAGARQYDDAMRVRLRRAAADMIVNEAFAMPATARDCRPRPVGFLPAAVHLTPADSSATEPVVLVLGSAVPGDDTIALGIRALRNDSQLRVLVGGVDTDLDDDRPIAVHAVVGRAGMGAITDVVPTGVPFLAIADSNPEIAHNEQVLTMRGWGAVLPSAADQWPSAVRAAVQAPLHHGLPRLGLEQTRAILTERLA